MKKDKETLERTKKKLRDLQTQYDAMFLKLSQEINRLKENINKSEKSIPHASDLQLVST